MNLCKHLMFRKEGGRRGGGDYIRIYDACKLEKALSKIYEWSQSGKQTEHHCKLS